MSTLSCFHAIKRTDDGSRPSPAAAYINAVFVGDRSGSMASMGSAPQDGAAEFLAQHKELADKNPDSEIAVTLVTFDDRAEVAYRGQAKDITPEVIQKVKQRMIPRNTTRLIDTAIEQLIQQRNMIAAAEKRYHDASKSTNKMSREARRLKPLMSSSFTLLTDGEDNMSHRCTYHLNEAIRAQQEDLGTVCLFAAANQDAVRMGAMYGFQGDRALQIGTDVEEARAAFRSCTAAAVRSATQQSGDFRTAEREASCTADIYNDGHVAGDHVYEDDDSGDEYGAQRLPYGAGHWDDWGPPPRAMRN